jgi:hypothetical protein
VSKNFINRLSTGVVATEGAARSAGVSLGLGGDEHMAVTGLFMLARDEPGFAEGGEPIWELRYSAAIGAIRRVVWIASKTGSVKRIYGFDRPSAGDESFDIHGMHKRQSN